MKDWANPSKGGGAKLQGLNRTVCQPVAGMMECSSKKNDGKTFTEGL